MATLYIHIGILKTGTSAIQTFLGNNRVILEEKGYCFPDLNLYFPGIGHNRNAHFLVSKYSEKGSRLKPGESEAIFENGMSQISKASKHYENIVLSDEGIWHNGGVEAAFWEKIKSRLSEDGIELKVVVYLRRQDLFIQSYWAQMIKEHWTIPFDEFIRSGQYKKKCILDYYDYMNTIAGVIGKENLIIRAYEPQQFGGTDHTLISDFMEAIGLSLTEEYETPESLVNISLAGSCLETKRLLNQIPAFREKKSYIVPYLRDIQAEQMESAVFNKALYFSKIEQLKFLSQYEEGNRAIAREYLGRKDGILFRDSIEASDDKIKPTEYTSDELIYICGRIIELQREEHIAELEGQKSAFKKQVSSLQKKPLMQRIKRKAKRMLT